MRIFPDIRVFAIALAVSQATTVDAQTSANTRWTSEQREILKSLSLSSLPAPPPDPSNRRADDTAAARLGHRLFFDTRFSGNGKVSCATCHIPEKGFQDGIALGAGVGTAGRRTMPVAGTAFSPWQFWDGRADSHWGQALGPLESAVEHGGDRLQYARLIATEYKDAYQSVFGWLPEFAGLPLHAGPVADTVRARAWKHITPLRQEEITRVFANIGKAIAAYERRVGFQPSRFDRYVEAELAGRPRTPATTLTPEEEMGLRLFVGKANCSTCHNGPLFTDNHFHNTGVPQSATGAAHDSGRAVGVRNVMASEFNCLGRYSDAKPDECGELRFAETDNPEMVRAFKTPSLRNVATRAPFMHAGQFATLSTVLAHYNHAPKAPAGKSELRPLRLSPRELGQIEAFLGTLTSELSAPAGFLRAPAEARRSGVDIQTPKPQYEESAGHRRTSPRPPG